MCCDLLRVSVCSEYKESRFLHCVSNWFYVNPFRNHCKAHADYRFSTDRDGLLLLVLFCLTNLWQWQICNEGIEKFLSVSACNALRLSIGVMSSCVQLLLKKKVCSDFFFCVVYWQLINLFFFEVIKLFHMTGDVLTVPYFMQISFHSESL